MKFFSVGILGNGSAVPTRIQNPTSQIVQYGKLRFMIDCGEGTQMQVLKYHFSYKNLNHIFISHLHGDHFFGLPGLISSFNLYARTEPLYIYGPPALENILNELLLVSATRLRYPLHFHALKGSETLYNTDQFSVLSFPLKHSIPTWGFLFKEKPEKNRRLKKSFVESYSPGIEEMHKIKNGSDYITADGTCLPNEEITIPPHKPRSYAYCSDTSFNPEIVTVIKDVSVLYHEATFMNDAEDKAAEKLHSTAAQAATIAKMANAGELLLGHFSARYSDKIPLLEEAKAIFPNSLLTEQGTVYRVDEY